MTAPQTAGVPSGGGGGQPANQRAMSLHQGQIQRPQATGMVRIEINLRIHQGAGERIGAVTRYPAREAPCVVLRLVRGKHESTFLTAGNWPVQVPLKIVNGGGNLLLHQVDMPLFTTSDRPFYFDASNCKPSKASSMSWI